MKHNGDYYHLSCFICSECEGSLPTEGFFQGEEGRLFCEADFDRLFKKKCGGCGGGVEGEVLCALKTIFHKECFVCSTCRKSFEEGDKVSSIGDEYLCSGCFDGGDGVEGEAGLKEKPSLVNQSICQSGNEQVKETTTATATTTTATTTTTTTATTTTIIKDNPPNYGHFYQHSFLSHDDRPIWRAISINAPEPSPKHYHRPVDFSYSQVVRDFIRLPQKESSILLSNLDKEVPSKKGGRRVGEVVMGMNNKEPVRLARLPDGRLKVKLSNQDYRDVLEKGDIENKEKEGSDDEDEEEDEIDLVTGLKRMKLNPALRIYGPTCNLSPSLADLFKQTPPPQVYAYEELKLCHFKLPFGVERESIEKHLSEEDFSKLFRMPRGKYYELPEWRRNDMKRKVNLY